MKEGYLQGFETQNNHELMYRDGEEKHDILKSVRSARSLSSELPAYITSLENSNLGELPTISYTSPEEQQFQIIKSKVINFLRGKGKSILSQGVHISDVSVTALLVRHHILLTCDVHLVTVNMTPTSHLLNYAGEKQSWKFKPAILERSSV